MYTLQLCFYDNNNFKSIQNTQKEQKMSARIKWCDFAYIKNENVDQMQQNNAI